MRPHTNKHKVEAFMQSLGKAAKGPVRIYLTGGTTAGLPDCRETTVDLDPVSLKARVLKLTEPDEQAGFTLIEIMVAVLVLGLLLAIAVGHYERARLESQRVLCIENLRQIDSAKERWALDNGASDGDSIPGGGNAINKGKENAFAKGFNQYLENIPKCPAGGTYTIRKIGRLPSCTVAGHTLE